MSVLRTVLVLTLVLLVSCGDTGVTTPDSAPRPQPAPDGVLLEGNPNDVAFDATGHLPPTPAAMGERVDGLLASRMIAVLDPAATVGQVNAALEAEDARIVSMSPQNVLLTLKVPLLVDRAAADALATRLASSDAFHFAMPAADRRPELPRPDPDKLLPGTGDSNIDHLIAMSMPAAWNVRRLATLNANRVTVVVPDYYHSSTSLAEIGAQNFLPGINGGTPDPGENHGFHVSGIIGANFDATGPTGTSPDPTQLLDIRSLHVNGLAGVDWLRTMVEAFPENGNFVLSTSLGYVEDPDLDKNDLILRAFEGLSWRVLAGPDATRFFHATAAGNEGELPGNSGDARYGSEFNVSSLWGNPRDIVPPDSLTAAEQQGFDVAYDAMLAAHPYAADVMTNIKVVGASDDGGTEAAFSNRNSDLRAVGVRVYAPCAVQDSDFPADPDACDGSVARYSGSSMATPAVAGLASYLWSLKPDLSPQQIGAKLQHAYAESRQPGVVDSYVAVLSLDVSQADAPIRQTLLDIVGGTVESGPNGRFDEIDLEAFLMWFEHYELERGLNGGNDDYSRYDLNGDGLTGGGFQDGFDLDVNAIPTFGTVSQTTCSGVEGFDEDHVSDLDILRYYAYSPLYVGDEERRVELLCGDQMVEIVGLPERVIPEGSHSILIRAGTRAGGTVTYEEGVSINLRLTNGTATATSGITDASGEFAVDVSMRAEFDANDYVNELRIEATAHFETGDVQASVTARRPNAIVLKSRSESVELESYFFYDPTPAPGAEIVFNADVDSVIAPSGTETFDLTTSLDESGTGEGMSARGEIEVHSRSTITGSEAAFSGASVEATSTGSVQLNNPNTDVQTYSAYVRARAGSDVNFWVYGDPATFTVTGSQSGNPNGYFVWIFGPGENGFECTGDDGCTTIGGSGTIEPGRYSFVTRFHKFVSLSWCQNEGCGSAESGTRSADSHLSATLGVVHVE